MSEDDFSEWSQRHPATDHDSPHFLANTSPEPLIKMVTDSIDTELPLGIEEEIATPRQMYLERANRIWDTLAIQARPLNFEEVLKLAVDLFDPDQLADRLRDAEAPPLDLGPDPDSARIILSSLLDRGIMGFQDFRRLITLRMAKSMEQWELRGLGTREQRVDTVFLLTQQPLGQRVVSDLSRELFRYLRGQTERGLGYCQTIANVAVASSRVPSGELVSVSIAQYGMHVAARMQEVGEDTIAEEEVRGWRQVVRKLASIEAGELMALERRLGRIGAESTKNVLNDLVEIQMAVSDDPDRQVELAIPTLGASSQGTSLAPLGVIGLSRYAASITDDPLVGPYLDTLSALRNLIEGRIDIIPAIMFNIGVHLMRVQKSEWRSQLAEMRVVVNAVGVLWSLLLEESGDLLSALIENDGDGLDCAVNLMGSLVSARDVVPGAFGESGSLRTLARTASGIGSFRAPIVARAPAMRADVIRIDNSARTLGEDAPHFVEFDDLRAALISACADLAGLVLDDALLPNRDHQVQFTLDVLIRSFAERFPHAVDAAIKILNGLALLRNSGNRLGNASQLADLRRALERYGKYLDNDNSAPGGQGPLVLARLASESEWRSVQEELSVPLDSLAHSLRAVSLDAFV